MKKSKRESSAESLHLDQRLVDSQLATIFQISRTPIRDAMRRLTKEGLLTNTSSRGFYVFAPTLKDIDEIFSISGMIETEAAARIIRRLRENPSPRLEEELNILEKKASEVFLWKRMKSSSVT